MSSDVSTSPAAIAAGGRPPRFWGLVLLSGVLSVIVGILALAVPGATLLFLGLLFGASLMVTGVSLIASGVAGEGTAGRQTLSVLLGFVSVLAGLFCFVRPGAGVAAVVLSVAFWFMLVGFGDLVQGLQDPSHRIWRLVLAVIAIAAGVVLVVDPVIGLSTVALLAGLGFLLRGVAEIGLGLQLRKLAQG